MGLNRVTISSQLSSMGTPQGGARVISSMDAGAVASSSTDELPGRKKMVVNASIRGVKSVHGQHAGSEPRVCDFTENAQKCRRKCVNILQKCKIKQFGRIVRDLRTAASLLV